MGGGGNASRRYVPPSGETARPPRPASAGWSPGGGEAFLRGRPSFEGGLGGTHGKCLRQQEILRPPPPPRPLTDPAPRSPPFPPHCQAASGARPHSSDAFPRLERREEDETADAGGWRHGADATTDRVLDLQRRPQVFFWTRKRVLSWVWFSPASALCVVRSARRLCISRRRWRWRVRCRRRVRCRWRWWWWLRLWRRWWRRRRWRRRPPMSLDAAASGRDAKLPPLTVWAGTRSLRFAAVLSGGPYGVGGVGGWDGWASRRGGGSRIQPLCSRRAPLPAAARSLAGAWALTCGWPPLVCVPRCPLPFSPVCGVAQARGMQSGRRATGRSWSPSLLR